MVIDPRISDDETTALVDGYKTLLTNGGAVITKEESWGKRKLAYAINKLTEGRYIFLYLEVDGKNPLPEVELRMRQNDKVLRYLTVRTDLDLKRAANKGGKMSMASESSFEEPAEEAEEKE